MSPTVRRVKMETCIHPDTYRYFISAPQSSLAWTKIETVYGAIQRNPFQVMWVETASLMIKAPPAGSPITVLRKRRCTAKDIDQFHQIIGFDEPPSGTGTHG